MIRSPHPIVLILLACLSTLSAAETATRWTMINVCPNREQADCHLIEFPDGKRVLVDIGDAADAAGTAVGWLQRHGITRIDTVIISHFHLDHYGRLLDLIHAGIFVREVLGVVPDERSTARERPWGCNLAHVNSVLQELMVRQIPFRTPAIGERLVSVRLPDGNVAGLDLLSLYDGANTPIGVTDVNETSLVVRLFHGPTRALFTGDIGWAMGRWLAHSPIDLGADIIKVPHHGTENLAPNEFFERVGARAALVPSPRELWFSLRSKRARTYFAERNIPAYVSGISGDVTVMLTGAGFSLTTQY